MRQNIKKNPPHNIGRILINGKSIGTCSFIGHNRVLTCRHIINEFASKPIFKKEYKLKEKCKVTVRFPTRQYKLKRIIKVCKNTYWDMGILELELIEAKGPIRPIQFPKESTIPEQGTPAIVLGYPRGYSGRFPKYMPGKIQEYYKNSVAHSCKTTKGYSGGPILIKSNQAIGMNFREFEYNGCPGGIGVNHRAIIKNIKNK